MLGFVIVILEKSVLQVFYGNLRCVARLALLEAQKIPVLSALSVKLQGCILIMKGDCVSLIVVSIWC